MRLFFCFPRIVVLAVALFCLLKSNAATFTVINTNDAGAGSLRQAITSANTNPLDADNILFNIPTTDPNYNAATGVFTITLISLLPTVNSISVSIDATTQPGNTNPDGPEICLKSNSNLMYGIALPLSGGVVKGFIINGFMYGVAMTNYLTYPSGSCTVSDCYIGTNYNATAALPNDIGIAVLVAGSNTITNNVISGNTTAGIALRNSNSNTIRGNKIGTDRTGMVAVSNYNGVAVDSSSSNIIGGNTTLHKNIISGNSYAGVAIHSNRSHNNVIKGNYIGINANGNTRADTLPNYYGIAINDSYSNIIGGSAATERNIISGNLDGGISMLGASSKQNSIKGNYIGTNVGGTDSIPNANGILLSGAAENTIGGSNAGEGNVISGNSLGGIVFAYSGARLNSVKGNFIGTNYLGTQPLSNHTGIYIKSNANNNTIGGTTATERNIISGNIEMGLIVEAADSNIIIGNYIGPDVTGMLAFKYSNDTLVQANGLMFNTNSKYNIAGGYTPGERNVISGNRVYGHDIYGNSSYNLTIGNYIGVDATGNNSLPNATGICVDGGSNHNPFINNVLSGNLAYGMFIVTTGSDYNELKGNKIGTNASGTAAVPNQIGLIFGGGTKYNTIGGTAASDRNIISGNLFSGIEMADLYTSYNNIIGNYIGTDVTGTSALPNFHGIGIATNPSKNNIESNVISGNVNVGLIIYEGCDSNTAYSNYIGVAADGNSPLPNHRAGVLIAQQAKNNKIGMPAKGNLIAYNDTAGIIVMDTNTIYNTISANLIYNNGLMGIDLFPFGPNMNDAGDGDLGANERMNFPIIESATYNPTTGNSFISGTMDCNSYGGPVGITIELFKSNGSNMFNQGDAVQYLGSTTVTDNLGNWSFACTGLGLSDMITATATDIKGNTSEFSSNSGLVVGVNEVTRSYDYTVYPNPATTEIQISFAVDAEKQISIHLYSLTGQWIALLENKTFAAGNYSLSYNLSSYPQGMYFLGMSENGLAEREIKLIISR